MCSFSCFFPDEHGTESGPKVEAVEDAMVTTAVISAFSQWQQALAYLAAPVAVDAYSLSAALLNCGPWPSALLLLDEAEASLSNVIYSDHF